MFDKEKTFGELRAVAVRFVWPYSGVYQDRNGHDWYDKDRAGALERQLETLSEVHCGKDRVIIGALVHEDDDKVVVSPMIEYDADDEIEGSSPTFGCVYSIERRLVKSINRMVVWDSFVAFDSRDMFEKGPGRDDSENDD